VWYRITPCPIRLRKSYIVKFNVHLAFENTGDRIKLDKIVYQNWIEDDKFTKDEGFSFREIGLVWMDYTNQIPLIKLYCLNNLYLNLTSLSVSEIY